MVKLKHNSGSSNIVTINQCRLHLQVLQKSPRRCHSKQIYLLCDCVRSLRLTQMNLD